MPGESVNQRGYLTHTPDLDKRTSLQWVMMSGTLGLGPKALPHLLTGDLLTLAGALTPSGLSQMSPAPHSRVSLQNELTFCSGNKYWGPLGSLVISSVETGPWLATFIARSLYSVKS